MLRSYRSLSTICGVAGFLVIFASPARAQGFRSPSLSGYGGADSGMGMSGGTVIPYNGSFGGFMPSRMGGSASLSFRPFARTEVEPARSSFRLNPMTGGASSMSGGGFSSGMGETGIGGMPATSGAVKMGVMPPSFAYPFRQPPSLLGPSSISAGMAM